MNINNKDVIQSYIMTTAKYDFSADEKRILLRLVETWQYLLEGKELKGKIDRDLFGGYILEFPISYFVPDNQTNYKRIKDALRSLNDKKFEYEDSNLWEIIRIIERPQIRKREKVIFELNEKIVECFLNFTKGYRKFELETALSFSSVYAVRFYELMSGQTTPLTFTFTKLKEMFQLTDKYPRTPDFIKRVIEPAKRELDEKSPFSFEYRYKEPDMKDGKKFYKIMFYPIAIPRNRDEHVERKDLLSQKVNLSAFLDKVDREYLAKLGFSDRQIKNNYDLILSAKKELDLVYELSFLIGKVRGKKNPQGYVISTLKGKLKDKKIK